MRITLLQRLVNDHYFLNSLFEEGCENEIICQIKKETLHIERYVKEIHFIVRLSLYEKPLYVY
jgi:hypothetical protein